MLLGKLIPSYHITLWHKLEVHNIGNDKKIRHSYAVPKIRTAGSMNEIYFVYLGHSIYLSTYLSIYLSIYLFIYLSIALQPLSTFSVS
jgi:hypothetical protein